MAGISSLKGRIWCVVRKSGRQCLMALITLGLMSKIQVNLVCFFQFICFEFLTSITFLFLASIRPRIIGEQEDFIRHETDIPLDERKCWDLITLDTLHAYCGGPEPTLEVRHLTLIPFSFFPSTSFRQLPTLLSNVSSSASRWNRRLHIVVTS